MKQWKVVVTDYIENNLDWEVEQFAAMPDVTFEHYQLKQSSKPELIEKVKDADIVVVNMAPFDAEVIGSLDQCLLLIRHGIGYDNVDVPACTDKLIRFAYQPDYCATEVAEQAVALIMCCARKLFASLDVLKDASANQIWNFAPMGEVHRLFGQTLGIIGCGRIGGRVVRIMKAMGMKIMVCDPYLDERQKGALGIDQPYDLDTVLQEADIISLHTPLNDETRYMIDAPQLQMMKDSAILINTARGALINTAALAQALREGWIAGAGIDVYEKEPPPPDMPLFDAPNATLSAHIGWMSVEAGWDIRTKIMDDIKSCMAGQPPRNTVNKEIDGLLGGKVYRDA
ncbi:MAG: C-terminal binding protein [Armatimonadetes bacterium]|nr:C-terminal binding protein [Armatimonadota bacterium]